MLRTRVGKQCHGLLTVENATMRSVLDARQRFVDREHVGDDLCASRLEIVAVQAANNGPITASGAADT